MTINPLVAARVDGPTDAWSGVWLAEDIKLIKQGIDDKSWIDGTLGVVGAGLDALALVSDPVGVLLQYGIAWLIEHVRPLLARTLAHERFHLDEIRQGLPYPTTDAARQAWENRAYTFENQWWDLHKHLLDG